MRLKAQVSGTVAEILVENGHLLSLELNCCVLYEESPHLLIAAKLLSRSSEPAMILGLQTVAVYSEVDAEALHVLHADEAICIGEAPSQSLISRFPISYLPAK